MKSRLIGIVVFVVINASVFGQSYNSYFNQFEIKSHYGFTIPHRSNLKYLIKSNIIIEELNYSIKTDGSKSWHHVWRFPEIGVGYLMGGLGNINVFGFSQSVFMFFGVPIIENDKIIFKYRMGAGLAYLSDKFDYRSNYYNIAVGSHFNAHLQFSTSIDYMPFEIPLYFSAGFTFNHFSNGAIETPNLGLNQVTANLGVKYLYSIYDYSLPKRTVPYMYNSKFEFSGYYAFSFKENSTYENKKFLVNSIILDAALRINTKRSIGVGINFIYDSSLKTLLADKYNGFQDMLRIGIHATHELYLTKEMSMFMHLGTYVYNQYTPATKRFLVYSKLGIRYTFNERIFANIALKTHTSVADYIEFGGGMRYNP
jgi:hypothetical protein